MDGGMFPNECPTKMCLAKEQKKERRLGEGLSITQPVKLGRRGEKKEKKKVREHSSRFPAISCIPKSFDP